jgi:hypothetical protein
LGNFLPRQVQLRVEFVLQAGFHVFWVGMPVQFPVKIAPLGDTPLLHERLWNAPNARLAAWRTRRDRLNAIIAHPAHIRTPFELRAQAALLAQPRLLLAQFNVTLAKQATFRSQLALNAAQHAQSAVIDLKVLQQTPNVLSAPLALSLLKLANLRANPADQALLNLLKVNLLAHHAVLARIRSECPPCTAQINALIAPPVILPVLKANLPVRLALQVNLLRQHFHARCARLARSKTLLVKPSAKTAQATLSPLSKALTHALHAHWVKLLMQTINNAPNAPAARTEA